MSIIDRLATSVRSNAPVQEVRIGSFWTAVVAGRCGLASTPSPTGHSHDEVPVCEAGRLTERSAVELVQFARSKSPLEAAVGLAALNALLRVDESEMVEVNARDLLVERGRDKRVALVGRFPFVQALRQAAGQLSVLELRPGPGESDASEAEEIIPAADVLAITGSSFVNGTIDRLLRMCRPESFVMVLGPSTPLSPVLFEYGVDVLSGTIVSDQDVALRCLSEGATFRQMKGVRLVSLFRDRGSR